MAKTQRICSIPDCNKPHHGLGYCISHLHRMRRHGSPLGGGRTRSQKGEASAWATGVAARFEGDDCLIWPFTRGKDGYGQLRHGGVRIRAHRLICELVYGPAPSPNHVCAHNCGGGERGCVNPKHLRWATPLENMSDRVPDGTLAVGERHGLAKLSDEKVRYIRKEAARGRDIRSMAGELAVGETAIARAIARITWKHVT